MPHTVSQDRRRLLGRIALGAAALPLLRLSPAQADDLPHLSQDDPSAKPLHYTADASKIDPKVEQTYTAGSRCGTCALFHADKAKGDWSSCDIFTTKAVNSHGWCLSYNSG
jgi:hypothetical protein